SCRSPRTATPTSRPPEPSSLPRSCRRSSPATRTSTSTAASTRAAKSADSSSPESLFQLQVRLLHHRAPLLDLGVEEAPEAGLVVFEQARASALQPLAGLR